MARFLLVEDELSNIEVVVMICEAMGHELAVARNGREALDTLAQAREAGQTFDLVLMDVLMPVMDGLTATELIRVDARFAGLPILGTTARAGVSEIRECLTAGMNAVVTKPFRTQILRDAIDKLLPDPRAS